MRWGPAACLASVAAFAARGAATEEKHAALRWALLTARREIRVTPLEVSIVDVGDEGDGGGKERTRRNLGLLKLRSPTPPEPHRPTSARHAFPLPPPTTFMFGLCVRRAGMVCHPNRMCSTFLSSFFFWQVHIFSRPTGMVVRYGRWDPKKGAWQCSPKITFSNSRPSIVPCMRLNLGLVQDRHYC